MATFPNESRETTGGRSGFENRVDNGRFSRLASPDRPLMRRKPVETYPLFPEKIFCLAVIIGESGDSGRIPRFAGLAFACIIPGFPEQFSGEKVANASDSRSGLETGVFYDNLGRNPDGLGTVGTQVCFDLEILRPSRKEFGRKEIF